MWTPPTRRFTLYRTTLIWMAKYDGERKVTVADLGAVPLNALTENAQESVKERMTTSILEHSPKSHQLKM